MHISKIISMACSFVFVFHMASMELVACENKDVLNSVKENRILEYEQSVKEDIDNIIEQCENGTIKAVVETGYFEDEQGNTISFPVYSYCREIYSDKDSIIYADTSVWDLSTVAAQSATNRVNFEQDPLTGSTTLAYEITPNSLGADYLCLKSVSGQYKILDKAFSVTEQYVIMKQFGIGPSFLVNDQIEKTPTGVTWKYNTGFTSKVLKADGMAIGVAWDITVTRQSSFTIRVQHFL